MKKWIKKASVGILAISTLSIAVPIASKVSADTVWYKDTKVFWNHGRSLGVTSFSTVQSSVYEHSATANSTFSGWKRAGVEAHAQQFIGTGQAFAYWNARG